jgi:sulfocyanin
MFLKLTAAALALGLVLTAPDSPPGASPAVAGQPARPDSTWLRWKPETRTATLELIAGIPGRAKSPFNFNGYTDGELTVRVPEGATMVWNFINEDGTPHSAQVIPDTRPLPNIALDQAAIPRAYTRAVSEGIAQFGKDVVRFKAAPAGKYLVFCGVPGHGLSGMWIRLEVTADSGAPKLVETEGR